MNAVKEIGPALFCGSWRIRDGMLTHRYKRPGVIVDLLSLGTFGKKKLIKALWEKLNKDEFSKGDVRDAENLVTVFLEVTRSRREVNRLIFPERVKV